MKKKKSVVILPSKKSERKVAKAKKPTAKSNRGFFAKLADRRRLRKEKEARHRAEELAKLPKDPIRRFFARLHPKRVFRWWFSWRGQKAILKFFGICFLLLIVFTFPFLYSGLGFIAFPLCNYNISCTGVLVNPFRAILLKNKTITMKTD